MENDSLIDIEEKYKYIDKSDRYLDNYLELLLNQANNFLLINNSNQAINHYKLAIKFSNRIEMIKRILNFLITNDYNEQALQIANHGLQLYPDDIDILYMKARAYLNLFEFLEAIQYFNLCIKLQSNESKFYSYRGLAYYRYDAIYDSLRNCNQALELDSNNIDAYLLRGELYTILSRYSDSEKDYKSALKIEPNNPRTYNGLGINYWAKKEYDLALKYFNRAKKADESFIKAYINTANIFTLRLDYSNAVINYSIVIDSGYYTKHPNILRLRGFFRLVLNELSGAIIDFKLYNDFIKDHNEIEIVKKFIGILKDYRQYTKNKADEISQTSNNIDLQKIIINKFLEEKNKLDNSYNDTLEKITRNELLLSKNQIKMSRIESLHNDSDINATNIAISKVISYINMYDLDFLLSEDDEDNETNTNTLYKIYEELITPKGKIHLSSKHLTNKRIVILRLLTKKGIESTGICKFFNISNRTLNRNKHKINNDYNEYYLSNKDSEELKSLIHCILERQKKSIFH